MKIEETFEGYAVMDGDDGYCFGVHGMMAPTPGTKKWDPDNSSALINLIDEFTEANEGKKIRIKISMEVLE